MFAIFPEILHATEKGDQETLSCLVRKYFAGTETYAPRLRVEPLLESLGVAIAQENASYYARIQVIDHRGQYRVMISLSSRIEGYRELNYTLAHLLGYLLNQFLPLMAEAELTAEAYQLESSPVGRLGQKTLSSDSSELSDADRFALALLMPLGMVKKAHQILKTEEDCAAFFQVPRSILRLRLQHISEPAGPGAVPQKAEPSSKADITDSKPSGQKMPAANHTNSSAKVSPEKSKSTSLARAQQSGVSRSYRQEGARHQQDQKTTAATNTETPGSGLKRLRELAKKIDKSVES